MKKALIIIGFNLIIYGVIYLFDAFVKWELKNPFQWIIDMATYTNEDRFFILFGIGCIVLLEAVIIGDSFDKNGNIKTKL